MAKDKCTCKHTLPCDCSYMPLEVTASNFDERLNAAFYYFKQSGKYYANGLGYLPDAVFEPYLQDNEKVRQLIAEANGGTFPGLASIQTDFTVFIVPGETSKGWPIMLKSLEKTANQYFCEICQQANCSHIESASKDNIY